MIKDVFELKHPEYWADPWRTRKQVQRALMQKGEEGLVLGTPGTVALNEHADFPAAIIRVCKLTTAAKMPSRPFLVIAAMDTDTWTVRAKLALPDTGRPAARRALAREPARDSFSGDDSAMVSEGHTVNLAAHLGLPASRRSYLVTAILLDKVSNRSRMKVVESAGFEDAEVDVFLREFLARRGKAQPVFPPVAEPVPDYRQKATSPAIPDETGLTLTAPRVSVLADGERCVVRGSFRLPISAQHRVKVVDNWHPPIAIPEEVARVPISLLVTGSVDAQPQVFRLVVPCYEPLIESEGATIAVGTFAIDLCTLPGVRISPQTYFLYGFAGEVMTPAVPAAFAQVPADALEPEGAW